MRIDVVFPVLPPVLDGIGDHTAKIARLMAKTCRVRVLTAQEEASPIPGVQVQTAYSVQYPWRVLSLVEAVVDDPPDWLLVQFNQFSYGRWGFNPFLPLALHRIRHLAPSVRIACMAHEDFVPASSLRFAIMRLWQRRQFQALGHVSDVVFFSIDPWVQTYGDWFPETPVYHMPIGSNMPYVSADTEAVRSGLGLTSDTFVAGFFGTMRARHVGHVDAVMKAMTVAAQATDRPDPALLYVGPDGDAFQSELPDYRVINAGRLPATDVSRHLQVMDVLLAPFVDGVSTRRGSFMAGLQHGVPTVGTLGPLTDAILKDADDDALTLSPVEDEVAFADAAVDLFLHSEKRNHIGQRGQVLYRDHFAFDVTVSDMLDRMRAHDATVQSSPSMSPAPV